MLPDGWQGSSSSAVEAYRYDPAHEILELVFVDGDAVYAYPCDPHMYVESSRRRRRALGRSPRPRPL